LTPAHEDIEPRGVTSYRWG